VRFVDFLRTTVLISAAAASALGAVSVAGVAGGGQDPVVFIGAGWWLVSGLFGLWLGRRTQASAQIASLLASARSQSSLPEVNPARVVLNRLWPLLFSTIGAALLGLLAPQVPAIAAGFAMIWALAWRRQSSAVTAIEERDGARFYVEQTSPFAPIRLVRTPGFRSNLRELNGASASRPASPRA
jgi:hypothetical protein